MKLHRSSLLGKLQPVFLFLIASLAFASINATAQPLSETDQITERYAEIHVQWEDDQGRELPLEKLLGSAESYRDINPDEASAWIVLARVRVGYASTQGIVRGMRLLKKARDELEQSIELDGQAENGYGQALLGFLYRGTPPWPVGFYSKRKGNRFLEAAYALNPASIETNYYYAQINAAEKLYQRALEFSEAARRSALNGSARPFHSAYYLGLIDELESNIKERLN
ncbi:MAG: hypothetical protein COB20_00465 [SAR86 cluster bacterium]|uniref:Tetratricopeptide repeat protein n=1 Tax=SAR86 cluster bacterium TaxID=2030880 RepID=A0A2A4XI04_9GAMM|nr:MAG: hypothetical protein COB20_00465 [SAR86 cluster bacterium]